MIYNLNTKPVFEVGHGWIEDPAKYPKGTLLYSASSKDSADLLGALKELLEVNERSAGMPPEVISNRMAFKGFLLDCEARVDVATKRARDAIHRAESISSLTADADLMCWLAEDEEVFGHTPQDLADAVADDMDDGEEREVLINCAMRMPDRKVLIKCEGQKTTYTWTGKINE